MCKHVIGLDFGTVSVRALIVDAENGKEVAACVSAYARWQKGKYCVPDKNQFRQHPLDYLESMEEAVKGALNNCKDNVRDKVIGIGIDTTGSTPVAVDKMGTPLALKENFTNNPNAMFILWKDHTAVKEADEINKLAKKWDGPDYTKYEGGIYSSEWFWAKIIHILRKDKKVRKAAYSWVEICDWLPAELTGNTKPENLKRSRCAAGHKAMWSQEWGGLPDEKFLTKLEPMLDGITKKLYKVSYTSDKKAGELTSEWAEKLGLSPGIAVSVGAFDAHMGAVGGGISKNTLVKIMGTSTCDIMVTDSGELGDNIIEGICGQVDGSVLPGLIGLEAGQSAFGDVYAWFKEILSWPIDNILLNIIEINQKEKEKIKDNILVKLTHKAKTFNPEETSLLALDWLNGRRTPYADQTLKGALLGLNLGSTAPKIFRSLVEATIFGSKVIADHFENKGINIKEVIALGGISQKNEFVMQLTADILNKPIKVAKSEQACALGAAVFGAVAADLYSEVIQAQKQMESGFSKVYSPDPDNTEVYNSIYKKYLKAGNKLEDILSNL